MEGEEKGNEEEEAAAAAKKNILQVLSRFFLLFLKGQGAVTKAQRMRKINC